MKNVIKILSVIAVVLLTAIPFKAQAKIMDNHKTDESHQKMEEKIRETTRAISKDIGLDEKQSSKVYDIKFEEAKAIEKIRADKNVAPNDTKNKILIIKNDANSKVEKVLSKEQKVLWNAKKDNYDYNPGFIENVKDKYQEKKEDIQERREEKKEDK